MSNGLVDGRFRLVEPLGRGHVGVVWHAVDEHAGGPAAVKLFDRQAAPPPDVRLTHPHVVSIFSSGMHQGLPFVAMELVDGVSLATLLEEGFLPQDDAVAIATQICLALQAAHAGGIVHGNLKPSNVLIGDDGVVKVGDFTGRGGQDEDMYALGMLMEAMSGHRDPVVERLLSRSPYSADQLHAVLTGSEAEPGPEPAPRGLLRLAVISGAVTLAIVVALCAWFLKPTSPPDVQSLNPSSGGDSPLTVAPLPSIEPSQSTAAVAPAAARMSVAAVKAVIAGEVKAGNIHADAAGVLGDRLDEIARFQERGQTKQVNDRLAALKAQLTTLRRDEDVNDTGYNTILAAINKL